MTNEEKIQELILNSNENVEHVTTCIAEHSDGEKEHGIVITVSGKDVVLLRSELEEFLELLDQEYLPE